MIVDLVFPVSGTSVSIDHSYPLYAALCRIVPAFHTDQSPLRFAPLSGIAHPDGTLRIGTRSCFRVRLPDNQVQLALPLAGKRLDIAGSRVRLGVPAIRTLVAAATVISRLVTFKNAETPEQFLTTARGKLKELGVAGEPSLPIHLDGDRAGDPKRRIVRVKSALIVGYSLLVSELSAADSITLQERGLGGRTRMGCGMFDPTTGAVG